MTGRTHDLAAFTALTLAFIYLPVLPEISLITLILAVGMNFVGGLFPDIDQSTSDFWDNFRFGTFISKFIVPAFGGHRNFSHSLLGVTLIGFLSQKLFTYLSSIILLDINMEIVWYSFMIGVVSHVIMDMPTKAGVPLLWPLKWVFGIPPLRSMRITSGKFIEKFIVFPGLMVFTLFLLYVNQEKLLYFLQNNIK